MFGTDDTEEGRRLTALYACGVLNTAPEEAFDRLARMAIALSGAPFSTVSLVDRDTVWLKARCGISLASISRTGSFCSDAIERDEPFWIENAQANPATCGLWFVAGDPNICSYAGAPIILASGERVGVVAIMDTVPRVRNPELTENLKDLAAIASDLLELRRSQIAETTLRAMFDRTEEAAGVGFWRVIRGQNGMLWSPGTFSMFGVDSTDTQPTQSEALARFPAESLGMAGVVSRALSTRSSATIDIKTSARPDGPRELRIIANPRFDADGKWESVEGAVIDQTEIMAALERANSSDELISLAHDLAGAAVWRCDYETMTMVHSDTSGRLFPNSPLEQKGQINPFENVHHDDQRRVQSAWRDHDWNLGALRFEYRLPDVDDSERWALCACRVVFDAAGQPSRAFGFVMETTEAHRSNRELECALIEAKLSNDRLEMATQIAQAQVIAIDHVARTIDVSPPESTTVERFQSYDAFLEKPWGQLHPDDRAHAAKRWSQHDWALGPFRHECRVNPDGHDQRWVRFISHLVKNPDGTSRSTVSFIMDTTTENAAARELTITAESLLKATQRLELATSIANAAVMECDFLDRVLNFSGNSLNVLGELITFDEYQQNPWHYIHPDDRDEARAKLTSHDVQSMPFQFETRLAPKAGNTAEAERWIRFVADFTFTDDSTLSKVLTYVTDITSEKTSALALQATAAALEATTQRLELATSIGGAAVYQIDFSQRTISYSEGAKKVLSELISFEEYVANPMAMIHPDDYELATNIWRNQDWVSAPLRLECRLAPRSGDENESVRWGRFMAQLHRNANGERLRLLSYVTDITIEKTSALALQKAARERQHVQERMELAVEMANAIVWEHDWESDALIFSEKSQEQVQAPSDARTGLDRIAEIVHPEDRHIGLRAFQALVENDTPYCTVQRLLTPDGRYEWHQCYIKLIRDDLGAPVRTIGFLKNIHQEKLAEQRLMETEQRAHAASQAKSDFLANMSHEIRTPLNGIVGVAGMLAKTELSPQQKEMADLIASSGDLLERVLNDVLDYAKIEAGQLSIEAAPFDLTEILKSVSNLFAARAQEKHLNFTFEQSGAARGRFYGDGIRIRQIVSNLLSNAIKFTDAGSVFLSVDVEDDEPGMGMSGSTIVISVKDTGIGFDDETRDRLFARFEQADASTTRVFGGTGLGLAISRQLSTMMGGTLSAQGQPGIGATFTARLRAPRQIADAALDLSSDASDDGSIAGSLDDRELRILVAEDNPNNRKVMALLLSPLHADIVMVENGALAVEAVKSQAFDIVLMDIQMPVMDGLTAIRAIRAWERTSNTHSVPIVAVTANAMAHHVMEAAEAGADQHLPKPVNPTALMECIAASIEYAAERESRSDFAMSA